MASARFSLGIRTFRFRLALLVAATFALRVAVGASTSWAWDDFQARERLDAPLSVGLLFAEHHGHLNPFGSLLQWLVQHSMSGHYVPLMIVGAGMIGIGQVCIAVWAARMYGHGVVPLVVAGFFGLTMMLHELVTWWSVAVYAAPMAAASSALLLVASEYLRRRSRLLTTLILFSLCLLTSSKAVLLPIVLLTVAAACPARGGEPLGFRAALRTWRTLWWSLMAVLALYIILFVNLAHQPSLGPRSPMRFASWIADLFGEAVFPAMWGGPWTWTGRFGLNPMPMELVLLVAALTMVLILWTFVRWPASRSAWLGWALYVGCAAALTAYGRAGFELAGPALRYTFDMALPSAVVLATILAGRPPSLRITGERRWLAFGMALWLVSTGFSYIHAWPGRLAITDWSSAVRAHYPEVREGLLEQPMPSSFVLVPERLATYLTGDPGAPKEVAAVIDQLLGFDDQGNLVSSGVYGVSTKAPGQYCDFVTQGGEVAIPLVAAVSPARHTIAMDYTLSAASWVELRLGGIPTKAQVPAGDHRLYAVVEGEGTELTVQVANPVSTLCVHGATVGWVVQTE